jgi:hypothetical protein
MRDGVNINSAQKIKRLVLPDEVKNLPTRTCFVKLCGNYPITMLKVNLQAHGWLSIFFYKLFRKASKSNNKMSEVQAEPIIEVPNITKPLTQSFVQAFNEISINQDTSVKKLDIKEKLQAVKLEPFTKVITMQEGQGVSSKQSLIDIQKKLESLPKTAEIQEKKKVTTKQDLFNKLKNPEAI